jgi:hypothetical protein
MSRNKKIAATLFGVVVVSVSLAVYQSRVGSHEQGTAGGFAAEHVSLVNLIATPGKYNGKLVMVQGVCNFEFEGNALFLTQDDRRHGLTKNAIWASYDTLGAQPHDPVFASKFHGRYILVEGYFDSRAHGHLGLFSGAITNVTRIMTQ